MKLFKKKCRRCGQKKTSQQLSNNRLCQKCLKEIKAQASKKLHCPIDQSLLIKVESDGIILDKCTVCNGIWLDPGELKLIKGFLKESLLSRYVIGLASGISLK